MPKLDVTFEAGVDENGKTIRYGMIIDGARNPHRFAARLTKLLLAVALAVIGVLTQATSVVHWLR